MQDLVRVRIPDPAEDVGIREGALERVILAEQPRAELLQIGSEHLEAAGIVLAERRRAADDVQRSLPPGTCLREEQCAPVEVERCKTRPAGQAGARRTPAQAARDHQVQHEVEIPLEHEDQPLAEPIDVENCLAFDRGGRGIVRAEDEGAADPDALNARASDPAPERVAVQLDVRELGHLPFPPMWTAALRVRSDTQR